MDYEYLLLDCQSGLNDYTEAIFIFFVSEDDRLKNMDIIMVKEQDIICTNATLSLVEKLGGALELNKLNVNLSKKRRFLISKLYLKETTSYKELVNVMRTEEHLPALPFDFEVRESFAVGEIPVDISRHTAYVFGILRILGRLFPQLEREIEDRVSKLLEPYQIRLENLRGERDALESEITEIQVDMAMRPQRVLQFAIILPLAILTLIAFVLLLRNFLPALELMNPLTWLAIASILLGASILVAYYIYQQFRKDMELDLRELDSKKEELGKVREKIEYYTTLLVTESGASS